MKNNKPIFARVQYKIGTIKNPKKLTTMTMDLVLLEDMNESEVIHELSQKISLGTRNKIYKAEILDSIKLGEPRLGVGMLSGFAKKIFKDD